MSLSFQSLKQWLGASMDGAGQEGCLTCLLPPGRLLPASRLVLTSATLLIYSEFQEGIFRRSA